MPTYSRPRDGRNPVGSAVERRGPIAGTGGGSGFPGLAYDPYYSGYYDPYAYGYRYGYSPYWMPGFGYGMGYFSYDPFLFGGYGYGGYGYDYYQGNGGYGPGGYGGGSGGYSAGSGQYHGVGSLRLKVRPANAQVFIDGFFVGVVDNFDGSFQRLGIEAGAHKVELRAEGYEPVQFDVMLNPRETITYKGEMKRLP